jgi:hypothetical protein
MMKPIDRQTVLSAVESFLGVQVYVHFEAPGSIFRNALCVFSEAGIKGEGPYRLALRSKDGSVWIRMEGLIDYDVDEQGRLFIAEHDDVGRLIRGVTLSRHPLSF